MSDNLVDVAGYGPPHSSHKMSEWDTGIRCPGSSPRFYNVRACEGCEGEEMRHPAGRFIETELLRECQP